MSINSMRQVRTPILTPPKNWTQVCSLMCELYKGLCLTQTHPHVSLSLLHPLPVIDLSFLAPPPELSRNCYLLS